MMTTSSKYITTAEAAQELKVNASRVRQLLNEGRIEGAIKIGRDWLIPTPVRKRSGARGPKGVAERS